MIKYYATEVQFHAEFPFETRSLPPSSGRDAIDVGVPKLWGHYRYPRPLSPPFFLHPFHSPCLHTVAPRPRVIIPFGRDDEGNTCSSGAKPTTTNIYIYIINLDPRCNAISSHCARVARLWNSILIVNLQTRPTPFPLSSFRKGG